MNFKKTQPVIFAFVALMGVLCVFVQVFQKYYGASQYTVIIPIRWGFAKDLLDIPFLLIFGWGGWPAVVTELFGLLMRLHPPGRLSACVVVAVLHGTLSAIYSYSNITLARALASILAFLLIYLSLIVLLLAIEILANKLYRRK